MKYRVRDEKARRKLETLSGGKFHERLNMYAANFAEAHKAGRVTDQEFAEGITVGIWIRTRKRSGTGTRERYLCSSHTLLQPVTA